VPETVVSPGGPFVPSVPGICEPGGRMVVTCPSPLVVVIGVGLLAYVVGVSPSVLVGLMTEETIVEA
jgi:hypothetical protein